MVTAFVLLLTVCPTTCASVLDADWILDAIRSVASPSASRLGTGTRNTLGVQPVRESRSINVARDDENGTRGDLCSTAERTSQRDTTQAGTLLLPLLMLLITLPLPLGVDEDEDRDD